RAFVLTDRLDADLCPGRPCVDAHLVDIGAEFGRSRKRRRDIVPPRIQVAHDGDSLALLDVAELELLAKECRKAGEIYFGWFHNRLLCGQHNCDEVRLCPDAAYR